MSFYELLIIQSPAFLLLGSNSIYPTVVLGILITSFHNYFVGIIHILHFNSKKLKKEKWNTFYIFFGLLTSLYYLAGMVVGSQVSLLT